MQKLIIEARVNEYNMRGGNPHVPWTTAEIVADALACRNAGAAAMHFHARKDDGSPNHTYEAYRDVVAGIQAESDVLIHPTLGYVTLNAPASERLAHITRMVSEGVRPDFAPMDMGSSNVSVIDRATGRYAPDMEERVYQNSTATLHYFADHMKAMRLKPYLTAWNIAHLRETAQFMKMDWIAAPAYLCFVCTDNHCIGGHPGTPRGLQAFIDFLPVNHAVEWTVCNYGGSLMPLVAMTIASGGHISIGLGDWDYIEMGRPRNAQLVDEVVRIARSVGREIATPAEAKQILGMH